MPITRGLRIINMDSQICSPSIFNQNTSDSIFGQTQQTQKLEVNLSSRQVQKQETNLPLQQTQKHEMNLSSRQIRKQEMKLPLQQTQKQEINIPLQHQEINIPLYQTQQNELKLPLQKTHHPHKNIFDQKSSNKQQSIFESTINTQNTESILTKPTSSNSSSSFDQQTNNKFGSTTFTPVLDQTSTIEQIPIFEKSQTTGRFDNKQINTNNNLPFHNQNTNRIIFGSTPFNNTFKTSNQNQTFTDQSIIQPGIKPPTTIQKLTRKDKSSTRRHKSTTQKDNSPGQKYKLPEQKDNSPVRKSPSRNTRKGKDEKSNKKSTTGTEFKSEKDPFVNRFQSDDEKQTTRISPSTFHSTQVFGSSPNLENSPSLVQRKILSNNQQLLHLHFIQYKKTRHKFSNPKHNWIWII